MASNELRKRTNWQTISGGSALSAEDTFSRVLQHALDIIYPEKFKIDNNPQEFSDIYSSVDLQKEVLDVIYNVDVSEQMPNGRQKYQWGINMDFAIRNVHNGKSIFGEIKRQDGWVEGKKPSAGRGNAHERCCKYFSPGLLRVIRKASNISDEILPFWVVFVGDITRDPKRNREITFWFQEYQNNYFMWRDTNDVKALLDAFKNNILPWLL